MSSIPYHNKQNSLQDLMAKSPQQNESFNNNFHAQLNTNNNNNINNNLNQTILNQSNIHKSQNNHHIQQLQIHRSQSSTTNNNNNNNHSSSGNMYNKELLRDLYQVESEIQQTCGYLKKLKQNKTEAWVNECINSSQSSILQHSSYPKYDKSVNYYHQFWHTYLLNEMMISKIKDFSGENKLLSQKISELDNLHKEYHKIQAARNKKKNRRPAKEIEKSYTCPYGDCVKIYGSEVSLNLHIKLKHNGGNKTERERLARSILLAQEQGESSPEQTLNFPPGYLDKYREAFIRDRQKGIDINKCGEGVDIIEEQEQDEEMDDEEYDSSSNHQSLQENSNINNNQTQQQNQLENF
ncbi:hypothetical protein PPERSA_04222 [Pseudocohnilembus persalinus]|uniref:C2H2-type domain-containing protein n=1 Tax=Pseudocohnilembus persalinus TaxID=266149 RepID=A0A0V0QN48_PSEPJ|nr:hypothetical protein PPERSA_04222 [Pseudocohnilembus persalinus]|eukprot:KRX03670.1 hypothetical protein PPERSA_04222 [Pseudocohnilembus persalinus]